MAGIKGRSGRKPLLKEYKLEEILETSSDILQRWLSNPEIKDSKKIPVVTQLIAKRIPAKLEHSGELATRIMIEVVKKYKELPDNGKPAGKKVHHRVV